MATIDIDPAEVFEIIDTASACDYDKGAKHIKDVVDSALYDLKDQFGDPAEADEDWEPPDHNDMVEFVQEAADSAVIYTMDAYNVVFYLGHDIGYLDDFGAENFDQLVAQTAYQLIEEKIFEAARAAGYDV